MIFILMELCVVCLYLVDEIIIVLFVFVFVKMQVVYGMVRARRRRTFKREREDTTEKVAFVFYLYSGIS